MSPLPRLMVAPNGARKGKADHPALPVTIEETVATARACHAAGAGALHAHIRDDAGRHSLDPWRARALLDAMAAEVPGMAVQLTTEAAGRFEPSDQAALVRGARPSRISVAVSEMAAEGGDLGLARAFYGFAAEIGIEVQHILYDPAMGARLAALHRDGVVPAIDEVLFVLGRYSPDTRSTPADLDPWLEMRRRTPELASADWMVCAFGPGETDCLARALAEGGKARVGFENNVANADGSTAADNAERVREIAALL